LESRRERKRESRGSVASVCVCNGMGGGRLVAEAAAPVAEATGQGGACCGMDWG
jgi:hypothetical protein